MAFNASGVLDVGQDTINFTFAGVAFEGLSQDASASAGDNKLQTIPAGSGHLVKMVCDSALTEANKGDNVFLVDDGAVDTAMAASGQAVADGACASCHGANGKGAGAAPRLAGQPAIYLILAAQAYKSGGRDHAEAAQALAGVSDADIEAASHYYASQR